MKLSAHQRKAAQDRLTTEEFDLLVIGGGINGAGVARDAASRGMKVALIEARDFAEGTSSRSSKLIHGGIRYLENLEFHLVFEALSERALLFEIAPHLVHPLRFVLPVYQGSRVGMTQMSLGMWLYDALSLFEAPELHERLSAAESVERLPMLQSKGLKGSFVYSDAYTDDDRLVIETLRSACRFGAVVVNHVAATGARFDPSGSGRITHVEIEGGGTIRAKHVVSTVGAWTDRLGKVLFQSWRPFLRPSKGVHLTFDRRKFQSSDAVVMAADNDKRIVFGIPRHEMFIVGTTDTDFKEDPSTVHTTEQDVDYLLQVANSYFPGAGLEKEDIIATYAGVRPLVHDGSESESKTSREHLIYSDPRGVTFVMGGKYTTYRRMAAETVEKALEFFDLNDRVRFGQPNTETALNPLATRNHVEQSQRNLELYAAQLGVNADELKVFVERHAAESELILKDGWTSASEISSKGSTESRIWAMEARHAIRETMCLSLRDFYTRRSPLFLSRADHGLPLLPTISRVFADEFSWSEAERRDRMTELTDWIHSELRVLEVR